MLFFARNNTQQVDHILEQVQNELTAYNEFIALRRVQEHCKSCHVSTYEDLCALLNPSGRRVKENFGLEVSVFNPTQETSIDVDLETHLILCRIADLVGRKAKLSLARRPELQTFFEFMGYPKEILQGNYYQNFTNIIRQIFRVGENAFGVPWFDEELFRRSHLTFDRSRLNPYVTSKQPGVVVIYQRGLTSWAQIYVIFSFSVLNPYNPIDYPQEQLSRLIKKNNLQTVTNEVSKATLTSLLSCRRIDVVSTGLSVFCSHTDIIYKSNYYPWNIILSRFSHSLAPF
ncbi:MAG: hypothetical protein NZO16_07860 [Deltaproteobacteria bacterium]|nr:hypothetical protein [Deltaproteobacteria bacterium]